ncbi:MAG: hypothetical protein ABIK62_07140, partial [candidate division WOR-3 bacterium]
MTIVAVQTIANYRRRFIVKTEEKVEALYLGVPPERLWLLAVAGAAAGALVLSIVFGFRPIMAIVGAIGGFLTPRLYLGRQARTRRRKLDAQLVDAITMVAGAMKAGMSLLQALEQVTREMGPPIRQEFAYALQE